MENASFRCCATSLCHLFYHWNRDVYQLPSHWSILLCHLPWSSVTLFEGQCDLQSCSALTPRPFLRHSRRDNKTINIRKWSRHQQWAVHYNHSQRGDCQTDGEHACLLSSIPSTWPVNCIVWCPNEFTCSRVDAHEGLKNISALALRSYDLSIWSLDWHKDQVWRFFFVHSVTLLVHLDGLDLITFHGIFSPCRCSTFSIAI